MLVILVSLLVLDALWIMLNFKNYNRMVVSIQGGQGLKANLLASVVAYCFIYALLVLSIVPQLNTIGNTSIYDCFRISGIVGLCVYGIYNFTNLAIYSKYSVSIAIADTLWGAVLFTLVAVIYQMSMNRLRT